MNCSKCGAFNNADSSFCLKCGNPLSQNSSSMTTNNQTINLNDVNGQPVSIPALEPLPTQGYQQTTQVLSKPLNFIAYIIAMLIKPWQCFQEEKAKLSDTKNSFILTGIIGILMMVTNLVKTVIAVIFVKKMNYSTWKMETSMDFSKLKDLDYVSLIGKNLLIYIGIIVAIAAVYYLATLVVKKSVEFQKLLSATASSFIPYIILSMLCAPLLGKVWNILEMILFVVGIIYSIIIFATFISDSILFENKDHKIYFHLICMSILICGGYYAYIKLLLGEASNILNFFS